MAKKKRRNDARLKVIAGGAAPKAVVAKPARAPKPAEPTIRRNSAVERVPAPVEDSSDERVSSVESAPAKPAVAPFPRWVVPVGIAAVVGIVAWAVLSKSINPTPPPASIPPPTAFSASQWPVASQTAAPVIPATVPSVEPALPSVSASAANAPSVSASAAPSAAPSTAPSASAPVPTASAASAPVPTASAAVPASAAAPKPKPAAPKAAPPSDDPYQ